MCRGRGASSPFRKCSAHRIFCRAKILQETAMNTQPTHDIETGDLRGAQQLMAKPDDIAIADLPNAGTDDMRGHEPLPETDVESDHTKMIVGGVVAAIVVGVIVSYSTGMWNAAPPAPAARVAALVVPAPLPAVAPQPAVVPAPVQAATEVESAPVPAPVAKRIAAPRAAIKAQPKPVIAPAETVSPAPPEIMSPAPSAMTPATEGATGGIPTQPVTEPAPPVLTDQPVPTTP
jgi:hypothetical protein